VRPGPCAGGRVLARLEGDPTRATCNAPFLRANQIVHEYDNGPLTLAAPPHYNFVLWLIFNGGGVRGEILEQRKPWREASQLASRGIVLLSPRLLLFIPLENFQGGRVYTTYFRE